MDVPYYFALLLGLLGFGILSSAHNVGEHAMGTGANATAVAYVELRLSDGATLFGVGIDKNIVVASLKAVVSGVNRALKR